MADLPVAAIVCLAAGGYTALILIIICIRHLLLKRGVCTGEGCCNPCGKEGGGECSECCISISEGCNCCNPSVDGCLNSICPNRKSLSCVDILLCQCFGNNCFTNSEDNVICGPCACSCSECDFITFPQCSTISCCCFEIKLRQTSTQSPVVPFTPTPPQPRARPPVQDAPTGSSSKHAHFEMKEITPPTLKQPKSNLSKIEQSKSDSTKIKQLKRNLPKTEEANYNQPRIEQSESKVNSSRKKDGRNQKRISQDKSQNLTTSDKTKTDEDQDECCYCPCVCPDMYFCGCKIHCMSRGERRLPNPLVMPVESDFNHEQFVTMDQKTFFLVEVDPNDTAHPSRSALGGSPNFRTSASRIPLDASFSFRTSPSNIPLSSNRSFRTSPSSIPVNGGSVRSTNL